DRIPAAAEEVDLRVTATQDGLTTALAVEGAGLVLEVVESGPDRERPRTEDALRDVAALVDAARSERAPPGAETRSCEIRTIGPGLLDIRAGVDPETPGWTWIRLLAGRRRIWEEARLAASTRERVG